MKIKNQFIYNYAMLLNKAFANGEQKLPIKINFALQKNKSVLTNLAQEIEKARLEILKKYGKLDAESQQYVIEPEHVAQASQELYDLSEIEQEVNVLTIPIDIIETDLVLTTQQMEALMFMIE